MPDTILYSSADVAYIEANFVALSSRPPGPGPSYVLDDGREFYPKNYMDQEVDKARFIERLRRAMETCGVTLDPEKEWQSYLAGLYGVCLRDATPENVVRKEELLNRIDALLAELRACVDSLDELERDFAPDYDRVRFGRPTTRDTYITRVRKCFLAYATT